MAGEWNVDKIARGMTAKQFIEWGLYARMEPMGERRADIRAASIAQMVFNMAVAGKDRKPLGHFLLKFEDDAVVEEKKSQPWQEKKAIAMTIVMAYAKARGGEKPAPAKARSSDEAARAMADNVVAMLKKVS